MNDERGPFLPYLLTAERLAEYEIDEDDPIVVDTFFDLRIVYVWVTDQGFAFVTERQVADLGLVAPGAVAAAAAHHLGKYSDGKARVERRGDVRGVFMGGHFEASFAVADFFWDKFLLQHFPNGCVVALPANDMLAFCAPDSFEGIEELKNVVARTFSNGDDLLSPYLYLRSGGKWSYYQAGGRKI